MDVDVSTPWGPFHHTRGGGACHDIKPGIFSFSLSLSRSFSVTLSLPPGPFSLYVPRSQPSALVTGSSHLFVWCKEGVALFLDLDEMRIACRMWKRSGTNGGMVQGQSSETKPLWAGCRCCICGGIWMQLQVPLGPLGFVLGLGLGSGEWAPRLSPRVTRAVYCLCATCLSVCLCGCSGWACRQLSGWLCACFRDIGPREEEGCVRGGGMRTGSMGPHNSGQTYGPIGAYYGPI